VFLFRKFEQKLVGTNYSKGERQSKVPSLVKGCMDSLIIVGFFVR
jgi:hypothetical protein